MPTPAQQRLVAEMIAVTQAVPTDWQPVPYGARWSQERPTPPWAREEWGPTYKALVWVLLPGRRPVVQISRAPWVARVDSYATFKRAHEVLADPAGVL